MGYTSDSQVLVGAGSRVSSPEPDMPPLKFPALPLLALECQTFISQFFICEFVRIALIFIFSNGTNWGKTLPASPRLTLTGNSHPLLTDFITGSVRKLPVMRNRIHIT